VGLFFDRDGALIDVSASAREAGFK